MKDSLNNLYYMACTNYTSYIQTGNKNYKELADNYFKAYKKQGGKKDKLKMI